MNEAEILQTEIDLFKSGKVDIVAMAARLPKYRELLVMCYKDAVTRNEIVPIEKIGKAQKEMIWAETKKESAGLDKQGCIELSKIVYLLSCKI